jgi:DNA-binding NarL/FixJ family response regulator
MSSTILIVEDEFLIALTYRMDLEKRGYTVIGVCSTGRAAIQTAEQQQPDVVLMDIHLKGQMDGIEAAELIMQSETAPALIFITGNYDAPTKVRANSLKPLGFFVKPVTMQEIDHLIQS